MWRKENPCALLVGMDFGAATVDNSMEVPQKMKNKTTFDPVIPLLVFALENENTNSKRYSLFPRPTK